MTDTILVFNAGSTSLKFSAYAVAAAGELALINGGAISGMSTAPRFVARDAAGKAVAEHAWGAGEAIEHATAFRFVIEWMARNVVGMKLVGAGHRIVLGGTRFPAPARLDAEVLDYLESLVAIEPSHQGYEVRAARALAQAFPDLPQVASFDTSFHRSMPELAQIYALPPDAAEAGARHWGYHGISYDYISRQLPKYAPGARRVIAAHLGGGASMCAMRDGKSVETTMGFAGLSGLPMSTRSGDIPPDLVFYLLRCGRYDAKSLEDMLYRRAGLLGLSGISEDMRVLQDSSDPKAQLAVDYFVYVMTKTAGAYAAVLGGLDALVFTAGIGENSVPVRARLCQSLSWLGIELDDAANARHGPRITTAASKVSAWVIPTNEERMIAEHTLALVR